MQETKQNGLGKKLRAITWMLLVCYFLRLWPFVVALLVAGIGVILYSLIKQANEETDTPPLAPVPVRRPTPTEVEQEIYFQVCQKVSQLVGQEFPAAQWVWASADARHRVRKSLPAHILLNHAGGYRRAKVILLDGEVIGLRFEQADAAIPETQEEKPDNYTLLAFQWVDANAPGLQERCNTAASQGIAEIVLPESELPVRASWLNICEELLREGFNSPRAVAEGIRLNTTKEMVQIECDA